MHRWVNRAIVLEVSKVDARRPYPDSRCFQLFMMAASHFVAASSNDKPLPLLELIVWTDTPRSSRTRKAYRRRWIGRRYGRTCTSIDVVVNAIGPTSSWKQQHTHSTHRRHDGCHCEWRIENNQKLGCLASMYIVLGIWWLHYGLPAHRGNISSQLLVRSLRGT